MKKYVAPEGPAIALAWIYLTYYYISGLIMVAKDVTHKNVNNKKAVIFITILFVIVYGFVGFVTSFLFIFSVLTYEGSVGFILPTVAGFILGVFLLLYIVKYLKKRHMFRKFNVLMSAIALSLILILAAWQLINIQAASNIFLRSFAASSIAGIMIYYLRLKSCFEK